MTFPLERIASDVLDIRQAGYEKGFADGANDGALGLMEALRAVCGLKVSGDIKAIVTFRPDGVPDLTIHFEEFSVDARELHPPVVGRTTLKDDRLLSGLFGTGAQVAQTDNGDG